MRALEVAPAARERRRHGAGDLVLPERPLEPVDGAHLAAERPGDPAEAVHAIAVARPHAAALRDLTEALEAAPGRIGDVHDPALDGIVGVGHRRPEDHAAVPRMMTTSSSVTSGGRTP